MNISDYLDLARERQGLKSYSQLAKRLEISQPTISHFRRGIIFPSDQTMVRIAELAGIDAREALLDLSIWRCRDTASRSVYQALMKDLKSSLKRPTAAALTGAMALTALSISDAPPDLKVESSMTETVYYV